MSNDEPNKMWKKENKQQSHEIVYTINKETSARRTMPGSPNSKSILKIQTRFQHGARMPNMPNRLSGPGPAWPGPCTYLDGSTGWLDWKLGRMWMLPRHTHIHMEHVKMDRYSLCSSMQLKLQAGKCLNTWVPEPRQSSILTFASLFFVNTTIHLDTVVDSCRLPVVWDAAAAAENMLSSSSTSTSSHAADTGARNWKEFML